MSGLASASAVRLSAVRVLSVQPAPASESLMFTTGPDVPVMLFVPMLRATSTASTSRIAAAGFVCSGSRSLPGEPIASEQICTPLSSAARRNAACVCGSRSVGEPSVGNCRLT